MKETQDDENMFQGSDWNMVGIDEEESDDELDWTDLKYLLSWNKNHDPIVSI